MSASSTITLSTLIDLIPASSSALPAPQCAGAVRSSCRAVEVGLDVDDDLVGDQLPCRCTLTFARARSRSLSLRHEIAGLGVRAPRLILSFAAWVPLRPLRAHDYDPHYLCILFKNPSSYASSAARELPHRTNETTTIIIDVPPRKIWLGRSTQR